MKLFFEVICVGLAAASMHVFSATAPPQQAGVLPPATKNRVIFDRDIRPIFEASCVKCHGRGRDKGGFQLDTRQTILRGGDSGPAVSPGKSQDSLLITLVAGLDPENIMPKKGSRLTPNQIGLLRAWIDQDLPWEGNFTFARPIPLNLTPREPKLPPSGRKGENPIDRLLGPYFALHKIKSADAISDALFARRVYLDVLGLLPPPGDLDRFLSEREADKRGRLVHRLLQENEQYAEHWLSFWNDLLRNDYRGTGYIDGGRKQITRWLFSALSTNMPYDQFVSELLAPSPASEGFINGIVWRGVVNASQTPQMQAAQNVSQVFMGVNLKCASCHDSFVSDWRLSDAYGLACVYSDSPLEMFQCDKPIGKRAEARFLYPQLGEIDAQADKTARTKRLAEIVISPKDGRLTRTIVNRFWERFFGRGLVEPLDDMEQPAWNQDLLDWLGANLVSNRYDLKKTIELMLTSQAYQFPSVNLGEAGGKDFVFRGPGVRRMSAEQFRDAIAALAGVWPHHSELPSITNHIRASLVAADPLATALGRPNREQVVTVRASAATTLQALELTNGKTLADLLQTAAEQLTATSLSAGELTEELYMKAYGRTPTANEKDLATALLGTPVRKDGVEDLLWAMVMLPEFQLVY